MKLARKLLMTVLLLPALAWAQTEDYMAVSLNEVPENVRQTALAAKPGAYVSQVCLLYTSDAADE